MSNGGSFDSVFIFDLDGTLVDSFDQILAACQTVRRRFELKNEHEEDLKKLVGLPAEQLFRELKEPRISQAVEDFRALLRRSIEKGNRIYPGVEALLIKLRSLEIGIGVATSKPHDLANEVVLNSSLHGKIDWVQGTQGFKGKPNPEVVIRVQNVLKSSKYFMIGDRPEDVEAGKSAGCITIGVSQGTFNKDELGSTGASFVYESIQEIESNLSNILNQASSM